VAYLKPDSIFVKQNFWLKLIIFVLGSVATLVVPFKALCILVPGTIFYLLVSPAIASHLYKGFLRFLPFLATYSLLSTILGIPFPEMMAFLLRMFNLILLMVYFSVSLKLKRIMEDSNRLKDSVIFRPIIFFTIATLIYIKTFIEHYKTSVKTEPGKKLKFQALTANLLNAIFENWNDKDAVEVSTTALLDAVYHTPHFIKKSNVIGCIYVTFLILILSF
jgi:hypothetical protein